jgi:hypothetical protein
MDTIIPARSQQKIIESIIKPLSGVALERGQNRVFSQTTAFRPSQWSKWVTCPGPAEPSGGGLGMGCVPQPEAFLDDSLFPATRLAASVSNHHPKVIGPVDIEQGAWELCQPKLLARRHIPHGWTAPSPASRRPIRTQLGAPNSRASGPRFLRTLPQTVSRASPDTRRRLPVDNIVIYRESPVRVRGSAGAGGVCQRRGDGIECCESGRRKGRSGTRLGMRRWAGEGCPRAGTRCLSASDYR